MTGETQPLHLFFGIDQYYMYLLCISFFLTNKGQIGSLDIIEH